MCDFGFSRAIATLQTELLLDKDQHKILQQRNLCCYKESSNFPPGEAADMNSDLSKNSQREKDLVAELRSLLHDHPDLPPDHELLRWIHATSVK